MEKKLYRSNSDRVLSGVLGGIADYFDISSSILRIAFVALAIFSTQPFLFLLLYILGAIFIPLKTDNFSYGENLHRDTNNNEDYTNTQSSDTDSEEGIVDAVNDTGGKRAIGIFLIVLGLLLLLNNIIYIPKEYVLSLLLIVLGIYIIFKSDKGGN